MQQLILEFVALGKKKRECNKQISKICNKKTKLWRGYKKSKTTNNKKAYTTYCKLVKAERVKASFIFRLFAPLMITDTAANGFTAKAWINELCQKMSGKGGGKETNAQATLDGIDNVEDALKIARDFAKLKLSC
uniref:DHHA1 domain-containing protein n=1 Tax=Romanomermis culicivorax TaxID=13658 RepID=A0A915I9H6_ROMCU